MTNREAMLQGMEVLGDRVRLREQMHAGGGEAPLALRRELAGRRTAWWTGLVAASTAGERIGLVDVAHQFGLAAAEVDILLLALAPGIAPEFLDRVARLRDAFLFRGLDVDIVLKILFDSTEERFAARELFSPQGRLVRNGLLLLAPIGGELNPHEVEVRASETVANGTCQHYLVSPCSASRDASGRSVRGHVCSA